MNKLVDVAEIEKLKQRLVVGLAVQDCIVLSDLRALLDRSPEASPPVEFEPVTKLKFPVILRKMWSGSEVQQWLDENYNNLPTPPDTEAKLKIAENEVAWLVEQKINGVLHYAYCDEIGLLDWTSDNLKAMRFSRKEDAMQLTYIMEDADRVAEHVWMGSALKDISKDEYEKLKADAERYRYILAQAELTEALWKALPFEIYKNNRHISNAIDEARKHYE